MSAVSYTVLVVSETSSTLTKENDLEKKLDTKQQLEKEKKLTYQICFEKEKLVKKSYLSNTWLPVHVYLATYVYVMSFDLFFSGSCVLMYQSILKLPIPSPPPPPRAIPGHLTRVKLRTVGNLTQNEACPVGRLTFVSKRLSAVWNRRISQFFDSAREPRSRVIALVDSTWGFLVVVVLHSYIVEYAFV